MEEIAARARVSKPVVYEHFGGKEGLYAVVVDREMLRLEHLITEALEKGRSKVRIERAVMALLTYVEQETDGFQILVRDMTPGKDRSYSTLLNTAVGQVSHILGRSFQRQGLNAEAAVLYGQALVGMVSTTAQWWLDVRQPPKEEVAAHIVNLCWNGLAGMQAHPELSEEVLAEAEAADSNGDTAIKEENA